MIRNNRRIRSCCGAILSSFVLVSMGAVAKAELVGHWTFDDGAGTTAQDSANGANGNDAVIGDAGSVVWTNGLIGGSAYLTGQTNDNGDFQIPSIPQLNGASKLTITAWFKPAAGTQPGGDAYKGIVMTRAIDTADGDGENWGLAWRDHDYCESRQAGAAQPSDAGIATERERWYHLAMTWDGDANRRYLYVDGVQYTGTTAVAEGTTEIVSSGLWVIGSDPGDNNRVFKGEIDDVAIWDSVKDPSEVFAIYHGGLAGTAAPDVNMDIPAVITAQPVNAERVLGDVSYEVSFSITAVGVKEDNYGPFTHWFSGPSGGTVPDDFVAGPMWFGPFTITDYTYVDLKEYYCVLDGLDGVSITSDVVTVDEYLPALDKGRQSVELGGSTQFGITMPDNGQTFEYQWFKDDTNTIAGATATQLVLSAFSADDVGHYSVEVTWNGITKKSESAKVMLGSGLQRDMVALWPCDETEGVVAADAVLENDMVWGDAGGAGLSWTTGQIGGAANLPGSGGITRTFTAPDDYESHEASTWSIWVNGDYTSVGSYRGIFGKRDDDGNQPWGFNVANIAGGTWDYRLGGAGNFKAAEGSYVGNQWFHLAFTWNKASGDNKVYLNGEMVASSTTGAGGEMDSSGTLWIGTDAGNSGRLFDGQVDDVAIWSRALEGNEITAIYNQGLDGVSAIDAVDPNGPAAIMVQPKDIERIYGDLNSTESLELTALGHEPLVYQWRVDGENVDGADSNTLSINGLDKGSYDCIVSNSEGAVTSVVASIVETLPAIDPGSHSVAVGGSTGLRMVIPTDRAYSYQWKRDGAEISGATSSVLALSEIAEEEAGDYTVVVDLPAEDAMESDPMTLTVATSGTFEFQEGVNGYAGTEDTSLATNNGGNETQNHGTRTSLLTGDTTQDNSQRTGLIRFDMEAYDGVFDAVNSMSLTLKVFDGSSISKEHTIQVFRVSAANADWVEGNGGDSEDGATCYAQKLYGSEDWAGSKGMTTAGTDYIDEVIGEAVVPAGHTGTVEIVITPTSFSLTDMVGDWVTGNNGGLMLRTANDNGEQMMWDSSEGIVAPELTLDANLIGGSNPPEIIEQPESVEMIFGAGDKVTFKVVAQSTGFVDYQWYTSNGSEITGATTPVLEFDPAATSDAGGYYVEISNANGAVQSGIVELKLVLSELAPAEATIYSGRSMVYSLTGLSETADYTYVWKQDGISVAGATNAVLSISNATADSAGAYYVDVTLGNVTMSSSESMLSIIDVSGFTEHTFGGNKTGSADDVQDTEVDSWVGNKTMGGRWEFNVRTGSGTAHSLLRFPELENMTVAPSGELQAAVLRVKIRAFGSSTGENEASCRAWNNIQVRKILDADADWVESTNPTNSVIDGFTSYSHKRETNTNWSVGSNFGADNCEEEVLGKINWATVPEGIDQLVDIPLTGDISFIMDWINGTSDNSGLALLAGAQSGATGRVFFYSSEAALEADTYPNAQGPELLLYFGAGAPEIVSIDTVDAGTMELQWTSREGEHSYAIEATADLETWTTVEEGIVPTSPMNTQSVSFSAGMMLYRVVEMPPPPIFFDDFEDGATGWDPTATGSGTVWELGTPNAVNTTGAGFSLTAASSPDNCWGTGINSGSYANSVTLTLTSPAIDLSAENSVTLSFMESLNLEAASPSVDSVSVSLVNITHGGDDISIGDTRTKLTIPGWAMNTVSDIDVSSLDVVKLKFVFKSDSSNVTGHHLDYAGWFIDDVTVD